MKNFILLAMGIPLLLFNSCVPNNKKEVQRPNILFIMSDDHAYQAISAYGYGLNKTPNIDKIANEGALFTRFCVTNSLCAPSRAVLLTGKHSFINGKVDNFTSFNWDQSNFPKLLQANGYQTAMIGKIHLDGIPQGFDFSMVLPGQGHYYNPDFIVDGKKIQIEGYVTDIITETTLDWLKNKRDTNKPFCVLYHQKAPHRQWYPAKRYYTKYTKMKFKEPSTLYDDFKGRGTAAKSAEMSVFKHLNWAADSKVYPEIMDKLGIKETRSTDKSTFLRESGRMNKKQRADWDKVYKSIMEKFAKDYPHMTEKEVDGWRYQRYMQDYLGCIAAVDEGVGEVLDYLKEAGLDKNTIVVYTSDQGFFLGEHGLFDKRFMYKESFRTPLVIRYPKEIKPSTKINKLVQNIDFAPTFLDYAGVKIPKEMQGVSFRKLVSGETTEWRDAVLYTYYEYPAEHMVKRHYGIATERYKLIHFYYDIDEWELYDLKKDSNEMKNVYGDPEYAEVQNNLHKRLEELRKYYGDTDELDAKYLKEYLNSKSKE